MQVRQVDIDCIRIHASSRAKWYLRQLTAWYILQLSIFVPYWPPLQNYHCRVHTCLYASQIAFSVYGAMDGYVLRPIKILSTCNCCLSTSQSVSVQASNKPASMHTNCDPHHEKYRQNCIRQILLNLKKRLIFSIS